MDEKKRSYDFVDFKKEVDWSMTTLLKRQQIGTGTLRKFIFNHAYDDWFLEGMRILNISTVSNCMYDDEMIQLVFPFVDMRRFFSEGIFLLDDGRFHTTLVRVLRLYQEYVAHPLQMPLRLAKMLVTRYEPIYQRSNNNIKRSAAPYLKPSIELLYDYLMFTFDDYAEGFLDIEQLTERRTLHPALLEDVTKYCVIHEKFIDMEHQSVDHIMLSSQHVTKFLMKWCHQTIGDIFEHDQIVPYVIRSISHIIYYPEYFHADWDEDLLHLPKEKCFQMICNVPRMNGRNQNKLRSHIEQSPFIVGIPFEIMKTREDKQDKLHSLSVDRRILLATDDEDYRGKIAKELSNQSYDAKLKNISTMYTFDELLAYFLFTSKDKNVQYFLQQDKQTKRRMFNYVNEV